MVYLVELYSYPIQILFVFCSPFQVSPCQPSLLSLICVKRSQWKRSLSTIKCQKKNIHLNLLKTDIPWSYPYQVAILWTVFFSQLWTVFFFMSDWPSVLLLHFTIVSLEKQTQQTWESFPSNLLHAFKHVTTRASLAWSRTLKITNNLS